MGLFGKKNNIKSVQDFYTDCIEDFHKCAEKEGAAQRGLIFIPELIPLGEQAVLAYLKDSFYSQEFPDPKIYYYFIMALSIDTGLVYASKWHEDYDALKNGYAQEIIDDGPAETAERLLREHFPSSISTNQGNPFFQKIYPRWIAMHEPYWKLNDPREYTFRAMVAAYQLGVSMMLEKLGY